MGMFVVERYLAGWPADQLREVVREVERAAELLAVDGVRHLRSVVLPGDETCLCVFEGPDAEAVRRANHRAGLPVDRVVAGEVIPT